MTMGPDQSKSQQFYRYTDGEGRLHVVSSPDSLPPEARAQAERIELDAGEIRAQHVISPSSPSATSFELQGSSFALGFASALVLALLFRFMPQGMRFVSRLGVVAGVALLGIGLYLGLIRKSTGASTSPLASPTALIQDAKDAVGKVQQRRREQEAELRAIEAEVKGK